jgi:small subunit ribosomal protein S1
MDRSEETIEQETTPENESGEDTSHPMEAFLNDKAYGLDSPRRGEIRTGTIARITDTDILVDIGYKSEGVIPARELEHLPEEKRAEFTVGAEVTVFILRTGTPTLLSLSRAEEEKDWIVAQQLLDSKEVFEGLISGYNKGGLIVKLGGIRGFIPASQVSIARRWRADGDSPDQRWGKMVGEPIAAKVIEVERRRNRLILSERAAAREARDVLKQRLIAELKPGEVRKGHVISLADFGAFVDIGGADGLVHTSEISWKRISHPREVLKVGQEVEVRVLAIDPDQNRISLSLRELLPDPWDTIVEQFQEGQLVEGSITKLTKFGAFASLLGVSDYEVEGLIHISELSDRHIDHPREVVSESETLTLRIIRVDKERRRIGLSLKRVDSPEYAESDWQAAMKKIQIEEEAAEATEAEATSAEVPVPSDETPSEVDAEVAQDADASEDVPGDAPSGAIDTTDDTGEAIDDEVAETDEVDEDRVEAIAQEAAPEADDEVAETDEDDEDKVEAIAQEAEPEVDDEVAEAIVQEADSEAEVEVPDHPVEDELVEKVEATEADDAEVAEGDEPQESPEASEVQEEPADDESGAPESEMAQEEIAKVEPEAHEDLAGEEPVLEHGEIIDEPLTGVAEEPSLEHEPDAPDEE